MNDKRKFYEMGLESRLDILADESGLDSGTLNALSGAKGLSLEAADHMIENVVGTFSLPLGIARNFLVNGRLVQVPMVVEEPSVFAAAS